MRDQPIQLRPNWYDQGPYYPSPCIHCQRMLRWTGANSGITWTPVDLDPEVRSDWSTCWKNEVERGAYSGHEPWEATPMPKEATDADARSE